MNDAPRVRDGQGVGNGSEKGDGLSKGARRRSSLSFAHQCEVEPLAVDPLEHHERNPSARRGYERSNVTCLANGGAALRKLGKQGTLPDEACEQPLAILRLQVAGKL